MSNKSRLRAQCVASAEDSRKCNPSPNSPNASFLVLVSIAIAVYLVRRALCLDDFLSNCFDQILTNGLPSLDLCYPILEELDVP